MSSLQAFHPHAGRVLQCMAVCISLSLIFTNLVQDLVGAGEPFEIVFVSSDKSAEELMGYMKECHGDWLAVQHGTVLGQDLKKKYEVTGIPSLVVVTRLARPHRLGSASLIRSLYFREGDIISKNGRSEVAEKGPQVFQKWIAASK